MSAIVCLSKGCSRSCFGNPSKKCPYLILHHLQVGTQTMPRQSGKTTELVEMAKQIYANGYPVYYICLHQSDASRIRFKYKIGDDIVVCGWESIKQGQLCGQPNGFVFVDEILPKQLKEIMGYLGGHKIVAHYYTDR